MDFESATVNNLEGMGWCPISTGPNITGGTPGIDGGGVDNETSEHQIISRNFNGGHDPEVAPLKMVSPLGGDSVARLGNYA